VTRNGEKDFWIFDSRTQVHKEMKYNKWKQFLSTKEPVYINANRESFPVIGQSAHQSIQ
jgi:hypothetical protein